MRKKTGRILKLMKVSTHAVTKRKIIATICTVLVLISTVSTGIECVQALLWAHFGDDSRAVGDPGWWKAGHNWVVLNALELLEKDGYIAEADVARQYLQAVIDGITDADAGSWWNGWKYGVEEDNLFDMTDMGDTGFDGGGMGHFFDPWTHHGVGPMEDLWQFLALVGVGTFGAAFWAALVKADVVAKLENWRNWFGKNAAQAAGIAFNRAFNSWNRREYKRAMYFLGYVLHLLGDFAVPHHAACILFDGYSPIGHTGYEEFVQDDLNRLLPENPSDPSDPSVALAASTLYNINRSADHPIFLEDLKPLSDGVYIAGDTDQLTDTGSEIDALRDHGHIYQIPNEIYQFIDFAAHESIEWYPMANRDDGIVDFDSWWEWPNYIEAPDLQKKRQGNDWDDNHVSRLIFNFYGVRSVTADFEGADHNWESIDMYNWWWKELGYVQAWGGYEMRDDYKVGGPWVWAPYWGPEPTGIGPYPISTLQLETVVYRGLNSLDTTCDGWQLSEILVEDHFGPRNLLQDPKLYERNLRCVNSEGVNVPLPLLDEDLVPYNSESTARRIAAVHLMDLAYKLCAGMIVYFFEKVGLSLVTHPRTSLGLVHSDPYSGVACMQYMDESGKLWFVPEDPYGKVNMELNAKQGRWVRDGSGNWVFQPTGKGLDLTSYRIDGMGWQHHKIVGDSWDYTWPITWPIGYPDDGFEHTIRYGSLNKEGQLEPIRTQIFQADGDSPTAELIFGQPARQVNEVWHITRDTPITLTASDSGVGVKGIYYSIYSVERDEWVVGQDPLNFYPPSSIPLPSCWGLSYEYPFNLDGYYTITMRDTITMREIPHWYYGSIPVAIFGWVPLPAGTYWIYYGSEDQLRNTWPTIGEIFAGTEKVEVELCSSIEGVDVQVAPYRFAAQPGDFCDYNVSICDWYQTTQTYDLTLEGLDPTWFTFSENSVTVGPDETANVTLTVSAPITNLLIKDYPFTVTATHQESPDVSDTAEAILTLFFQPELPSEPEGSLEVEVEPEPIPIGSTATASVHVVNNQNFDDLIAVSIDVDDVPESDQADLTWFSWGGIHIFAPAGSTTTIPLTVTVPDGSTIGCKMFDVRAKSRTWPESEVVRRFRVTSDVTAPTTEILIGTPHYIDASGNTYVTSDTSFTLTADDGPDGTGVEATHYRYYNLAYDSGWTDYSDSFYLTELEDDAYSIDYYSTDNIGNTESTRTISITLDNTPPTTSLTIGEPKIIYIGNVYVNSSAPFTLDAADNPGGCGVATTAYKICNDTYDSGWTAYTGTFNLPEWLEKGGTYHIAYNSTDNLGNIEPTKTTIIFIILHKVKVEVNPALIEAKLGQTATYTINVTNLGNVPDTYNLTITFIDFNGLYRAYPTIIQSSWTLLDKTSMTLDPGQWELATFTIAVPANWAGVEDATYNFTATATCQEDPTVNASDLASLKVIATKHSMAEYVKLEIQWLQKTANDMNIKQGKKDSLIAKLTNAEMKVDQAIQWINQGRETPANNMLNAAQNILQAFINEVQAQAGKAISPADAQTLIEIAQKIQQNI